MARGCWPSQSFSGLVAHGFAVPAVAVLNEMVNVAQVPKPVVGFVAVDVVNGVSWVLASAPFPNQPVDLD